MILPLDLVMILFHFAFASPSGAVLTGSRDGTREVEKSKSKYKEKALPSLGDISRLVH